MSKRDELMEAAAEYDAEFFRRLWRVDRCRRSRLPLRSKRCEECPAAGMYLPINVGMRQLPMADRVEHVTRCWCHMDPDYACRGGAEVTGAIRHIQSEGA